jgi:predicted PurR-regulated permease PerM
MGLLSPTERQARLLWFAASALSIGIIVTLIVALLWGLGKVLDVLSPVIWPIAVAVIIAYLLDPVVGFFQKRGASRPKAIIAVFAIALIVLTGLLACVVPPIVTETNQLAHRAPEYSQRLRARIEEWLANPPPVVQHFLHRDPPSPAIEPATPALVGSTNAVVATPAEAPPPTKDSAKLETAAGWIAAFLPKFGLWIAAQVTRIGSLIGVLAGLALVPVYAFYFLLERHNIATKWTNYLPIRESAAKDELIFILSNINSYLIAFFRGQVLVAMCDGILYAIGFLIIGLPYALLIGAAAVFLTIIPFLGAIVIFIAAALIAVVQFGDWVHPTMVLGVFLVVQALEGLLISPRIMGGRVGLHPVTILIAVMTGTTLLGGILGGILAIPLTAALRVLMFRYVWKPAKD